jgi:hypothetical protein
MPAADTFTGRARQHDDQAVGLVKAIFSKYGFLGFRIGAEIDHKNHWSLLTAQADPTSIMLRFRPDLVLVKPGVRTVMCEVKSEAQGYVNFAVEFNSWRAATIWNRSGRHVMYALVDLRDERVSACWADDIPRPATVRVPRRWDWEKHKSFLQRGAPWANLEVVNHAGGSGTPYFLIPKAADYLRPVERFIERELTR